MLDSGVKQADVNDLIAYCAPGIFVDLLVRCGMAIIACPLPKKRALESRSKLKLFEGLFEEGLQHSGCGGLQENVLDGHVNGIFGVQSQAAETASNL